MKSKPIDYWRDYFRNTNCEIFEVIEYSITVAASDCPKEFRLRRDRIAEVLYSCRWFGCAAAGSGGRAGLATEEDDLDDDRLKSNSGPVGSKESKAINRSREDRGESNYSFGDDEIEALSDEIEEESRAAAEVLRIKEILINSRDECESVLYESLRRLQFMELSVVTLKATGIGKAVNHLRKNVSKQIARLAQTLISGWKTIVDEWFKTAPAAAPEPSCTPHSVNPSVVDEEEEEEEQEQEEGEEEEEEEEEGLPSPPMDEAFFAAQTGPIELSQFFDGMDDDGNPRNSRGFIKKGENGQRPPSLENENLIQPRTHAKPNLSVRVDDGYQQIKKLEEDVLMKPNRPSNINNRPNVEQQRVREANHHHQQQKRTDQTLVQKRQQLENNRQQGIKHSEEEAAVQMKLEAKKRRLQDSYQQAEKAKKQRTVQVMDLHDLPKQSRGQNNPHARPAIQNRRFVNGRR